MLSNKTIRKMGSTLCDLDLESLNDVALSKKKKKPTPLGNRPLNEAPLSEDVDKDESSKL